MNEYFKINAIMLFGSGYLDKRKDLIYEIQKTPENRNEIIFAFLYEDFEKYFFYKNRKRKIEIKNFLLEIIMLNISSKVILNFESPSTAVEMIMANSIKNKNQKMFYINQLKIFEDSKNGNKFKYSIFEDKKEKQVGFVANDFFKTILNNENVYDNSSNLDFKIYAENNIFLTLESETDFDKTEFKSKINLFIKKEYDNFLNSKLVHLKSKGNNLNLKIKHYNSLKNANIFGRYDLKFEDFKFIVKCFLDFVDKNYNGNKSRVNWLKFSDKFSDKKLTFGKMYSMKYIKRNNKRRKILFMIHKNNAGIEIIQNYSKLKKEIKDSHSKIKATHDFIIKKYSDDLNLFSYISKYTNNWLKKYNTNSGTLAMSILQYRTQNTKILKMDIKDFFNSLNHKVFRDILKLEIFSNCLDYEDFLSSIDIMFKTYEEINENINYNNKHKKKVGFHQGVSSSGNLSNLYLLPLDLMFSKKYNELVINDILMKLVKPGDSKNTKDLLSLLSKIRNSITYSRYSDDIIITSKNENDLRVVLRLLKSLLKNIFKLELNLEKTKIVDLKNKGNFKLFDFNYVLGKNNKKNYLTHTRKNEKYLTYLSKNLDNLNESEASMHRYLSYCNMVISNEMKGDKKRIEKNARRKRNVSIYDFFESILNNKIKELENNNFILSNSFKLRLFLKINNFSETLSIEIRRSNKNDVFKFSIFFEEDKNNSNFISDKELIKKCEFSNRMIKKMKIKVYESNPVNNNISLSKVITKKIKIKNHSVNNGNIYNYIILLISKLKWNEVYEKGYSEVSKKALVYFFNNNDIEFNKLFHSSGSKKDNFKFK